MTWQPQAEKKWLAGLLAKKEAIVPQLSFLKTTGVEEKEGARLREVEWKKIND